MKHNGEQFESVVRNFSDPDDPVEWIVIDRHSCGHLSVEYEATDGEHGAVLLGPTGSIVDLSIRL
jgi:hypothetical protein